MEHKPAKFALLATMAVLMSPVWLARAQTTAPLLRETVPLSISEPVLSPAENLILAPITAEAPPAGTPDDTSAGTPAGVIQTQEEEFTGADSGETGTASSSEDAADPDDDSDAMIIYPDAELPVLDLDDAEGQTQEDTNLLVPSSADCLDPQTASAAILPGVTGNQVKIALLVFLGAAMGALLFMLSNLLIDSARARRVILHLEAQSRLANSARRVEFLGNSFSAVSDILSALMNPPGKKTVPDGRVLLDYRTAAVDIEMFGSDESLRAHRELTALLSQPSAPLAGINSAKDTLLKSLQKDIGLTSPQTPQEPQSP